jgi:hypothetical protein
VGRVLPTFGTSPHHAGLKIITCHPIAFDFIHRVLGMRGGFCGLGGAGSGIYIYIYCFVISMHHVNKKENPKSKFDMKLERKKERKGEKKRESG